MSAGVKPTQIIIEMDTKDHNRNNDSQSEEDISDINRNFNHLGHSHQLQIGGSYSGSKSSFEMTPHEHVNGDDEQSDEPSGNNGRHGKWQEEDLSRDREDIHFRGDVGDSDDYDGPSNRRLTTLTQREEELAKATGQAVEQMQKMIAMTQLMKQLEEENAQLREENENLQNEVKSLDDALFECEEEVEELKAFTEELRGQLNASIQNVAYMKSESEKLKVERLTRTLHGDPSDSVADPDVTDGEAPWVQPRTRGSEKPPAFNKQLDQNTAALAISEAPATPKRERRTRPYPTPSGTTERRHSRTFSRPTILTGDQSANNSPAMTNQISQQQQSNNISVHNAAMDVELNKLKGQLTILLQQMQSHDASVDALEKENIELRHKLRTMDKASGGRNSYQLMRVAASSNGGPSHSMNRDEVIQNEIESRSKEELLGVIRQSKEEKVKWQTYAEALIRRILVKSPNVLEILDKKSGKSHFDDDSQSMEGRWETFALSLVQRVMDANPKLLENFSPPPSTIQGKHKPGVGYV